jgi:hypothetical protein
MAIHELDTIYDQRIEDAGILTPTPSHVASELQRYSLDIPKAVGHGMLLFGDFVEPDTLTCQPWVIAPDAPPPEKQESARHKFAAAELIGFHQRTNALSLQQESVGITSHMWSTYIWPETPGDPDSRFSTLVLNMTPPNVRNQDKLSVITGLTEPGKLLEDHDIYLQFYRSAMRRLKVASGKVTELR